MTDIIKKIITEFRDQFWKTADIYGNETTEAMESFLTLSLEKAIQESRDDERDKIVARLAVEIMEVELHKNRDLYTDGHIHGVKRAIYLIRHEIDTLSLKVKERK